MRRSSHRRPVRSWRLFLFPLSRDAWAIGHRLPFRWFVSDVRSVTRRQAECTVCRLCAHAKPVRPNPANCGPVSSRRLITGLKATPDVLAYSLLQVRPSLLASSCGVPTCGLWHFLPPRKFETSPPPALLSLTRSFLPYRVSVPLPTRPTEASRRCSCGK